MQGQKDLSCVESALLQYVYDQVSQENWIGLLCPKTVDPVNPELGLLKAYAFTDGKEIERTRAYVVCVTRTDLYKFVGKIEIFENLEANLLVLVLPSDLIAELTKAELAHIPRWVKLVGIHENGNFVVCNLGEIRKRDSCGKHFLETVSRRLARHFCGTDRGLAHQLVVMTQTQFGDLTEQVGLASSSLSKQALELPVIRTAHALIMDLREKLARLMPVI